MVSLCKTCANNEWRRMGEVIEAFLDAGMERPKCVWCKVTGRPEDVRLLQCRDFVEGKPDGPNRHKHGHRRVKGDK